MDKCPADILYIIFNLLSSAEYQALSLVNKGLRDFAEPYLYSNLHWRWEAPENPWEELDPPPPFQQLLRTIFFRPQVAGYVTSLRLEGDNFTHYYRGIPTITVDIDELHEPITIVRRTGVPYADVWIQGLRAGTIDAFVALLLSQLPNLRSLYLHHNFTQCTTLIGMVLRSAICESGQYMLPTFDSLQDVYFYVLDGEDRNRDMNIKNTLDVLPVLYPRNLERLAVSIENPAIFTWPAAELPAPSKLTSLTLRTVREAYLEELLSVTKNVKTFNWYWYFDEFVEDESVTDIVDLDRIVAAISHVKDTLTNLIISAKVERGGSATFCSCVYIRGSLDAMVTFDKVRRLQIPWAFLIGYAADTRRRLQDTLPKNVEIVVLTDELLLQNEDNIHHSGPLWIWRCSSVLEVLRLWLVDWNTYTPHLRYVSIVMRHYDSDEWDPVFVELGAQAGGEVELFNFSPHKPGHPVGSQWIAPVLQGAV